MYGTLHLGVQQATCQGGMRRSLIVLRKMRARPYGGLALRHVEIADGRDCRGNGEPFPEVSHLRLPW